MKMTKKGVIDQLIPLVTSLVVVGVVLVVGFLIMAEVKSNGKVSADNFTGNATEEVINAMMEIPGWLPIIIITVIGALLIGLVAMFRR